jgi:hypothetical protein
MARLTAARAALFRETGAWPDGPISYDAPGDRLPATETVSKGEKEAGRD